MNSPPFSMCIEKCHSRAIVFPERNGLQRQSSVHSRRRYITYTVVCIFIGPGTSMI